MSAGEIRTLAASGEAMLGGNPMLLHKEGFSKDAAAAEEAPRTFANMPLSEVDSSDSDLAIPQPKMQGRLAWYSLMSLTAVAWMADQTLLLALFDDLAGRHHQPPSSFSVVLLVKGLAQSVSALPAIFLLEAYSRPSLISTGCLLWASGLVGCTMADDFLLFCVCRGISGVGLGLAHPFILSLVADTAPAANRGIAFGALQFVGMLGSFGGQFLTAQIAPLAVSESAVWKCVFVMLALVTGSVGMLVRRFGQDQGDGKKARSNSDTFGNKCQKIREILENRTIRAFLLHNAVCKSPWACLCLHALWIQTPLELAQSAVMLMGVGQACTSLVVGQILDMVTRRNQSKGPPNLALLFSCVGVPALLGALFVLNVWTEPCGGRMALVYTAWPLFGCILALWAIMKDTVISNVVPQADLSATFGVCIGVDGLMDAGILFGVKYYQVWLEDHEDSAPSLGLAITITAAAGFGCLAILRSSYQVDRRHAIYEEAGPL